MDLRDCIASTLSSDSTTRVQAELTLKSVFVHIPLVLAIEADCYYPRPKSNLVFQTPSSIFFRVNRTMVCGYRVC
jgi:hypothetical protein